MASWTTNMPWPPIRYPTTPLSPDPGPIYLWSPLVIALVVIGCIVILILLLACCCLIRNYMTYGMLFPHGGSTSCGWGDSCCCMCRHKHRRVIRRRRISQGDNCRGSVRISKPCDDDVIVVGRPERKVVRIAEPVVIPQPVVIPSTITPIAPPCPAPCPPQPSCGGFHGGELRVVIGDARASSSSNRLVYNMNQAPSTYQTHTHSTCQMGGNRASEYVLTTVDGGMSPGGGFNKGFDHYDDHVSTCSDGQRSAIIEMGGGNTFYPNLPHCSN